MVPFESVGAVSDSLSIITMTILHQFRDKVSFIPLAFDARVKGGPRRNIAIPFSVEKTRTVGILDSENTGRTDRHLATA